MGNAIINSVVSWFLKKRIHDMGLFIKHPQDLQNNLLQDLIYIARNTKMGKDYQFAEINNYEQFKTRVPLCSYPDLHESIQRSIKGEQNLLWPTDIKWFAMSSGTTTSKSKYIPVSQESLEDCHYAAAKDLLCMYLNNNPDSKLFKGKGLRLGGSKKLDKGSGASYGDLSSILIDNMPFWADYSSTPGPEVALMANWEEKLPAIIKETLPERVTSLAGVPSWMLVLLQEVLATTNKQHILEVWPEIEVFFHGGVSFAPYAREYERLLPSNSVKYYETYNASEGFFAIQDQNNSKDLLLMLDYGIFYEFIPMNTFGQEDQQTIPLDGVELDKNYALVITTNAGLWRYIIGDTVRFTSLSPYRIRVTGRTKHFINVFGEELIIENAEQALKKTCATCQAEVKDYSVGPVFMEGKNKGGHEWIIEFSKPPMDKDNFAKELDLALQSLNSDYEAKRYNNTTLKPLRLHVAPQDLFYKWLKQKDKLGGQHKIPRLSNKRDYIEELLKMF